MERFLNVGLAQISAVIGGILVIKYILKAINKKYFNCKNATINKVNRVLIKRHKLLGTALIFTGVIHGISSPARVLSFNLGTATWSLCVLMYLSCLLKKFLNKKEFFKKKGWVYYHRAIALLFVLVLATHILTVKGVLQRYRYSKPSGVTTDGNSTKSTTETGNIGVKTKYIDGTYTGEGIGHEPGLNVRVTIENDKIIEIALLSNNETPDRCEKAEAVIPQSIIGQQSTDVDTVAGATESSNGIIEAVNDALSKAAFE